MDNNGINKIKSIIILFLVLAIVSCNNSKKAGNVSQNDKVEFWLTKADGTVKLKKQKTNLVFGNISNDSPILLVDENQKFQTIEGFGFTLTGGSSDVINQLSLNKKKELLQKLFGSDKNSISISYLRISIGASDLNSEVFSYNDLPKGKEDLNQSQFSLSKDESSLIPLLKEILAINPNIKIMGSPWSPPVWMKDNNSSKGGSLRPKFYSSYAKYFVKYIQQMKAHGIKIDAITPQNEPLHPGNNPSLYMTAEQQANFIKNHLGPAFQESNIDTKIIIYDHNCDKPEYPIIVLNDSVAKKFISGSAFHLYAGDISALTTVHKAHPDKDLYFTEQYTPNDGDFRNSLTWHVKNVVIGSMRNWSKIALEWNLANDNNFGPHTDGGCTTCQGAITINNNESYSLNVGYYIIAHASKFVSPGSVRIGSNMLDNIPNVAFKTAEGKNVLIVENNDLTMKKFNIKYNEKWIEISLEGESVGTFVW